MLSLSCGSGGLRPQERAARFLGMYDGIGQKIYAVTSEAYWQSATDVTDQHVGERIGAERALAAFSGSRYVIETARELLESKAELDDLTVRQLEKVMLTAAEYPGTLPRTVEARVEQEAKQSAVLDAFEFCAEGRGEDCAKVVNPNEIDNILRDSRDVEERRHIWEVSKQTGPALKPGLIELRRLRNELAKEMGFDSFFALQVADYGMTVAEMMEVMEGFQTDLRPLYEQVHCWAKYELAQRYGQDTPKKIPAHWIGNRWAQAWPGLTQAVDLDELFNDKSPEWIVKQAETFSLVSGYKSNRISWLEIA